MWTLFGLVYKDDFEHPRLRGKDFCIACDNILNAKQILYMMY